MTDRELLERAARAAGMRSMGADDEGLYIAGDMGPWNPLTDDGDALRLAIKLGIGMMFDIQDAKVTAYQPSPYDGYLDEFADEQTPEAATRRAIVRAAAAMEPAKEASA